jgi:cyclic nucleotide gated channel
MELWCLYFDQTTLWLVSLPQNQSMKSSSPKAVQFRLVLWEQWSIGENSMLYGFWLFCLLHDIRRFEDWRSPEPSVNSENIVSPRGHNEPRSLKERTDGVFAFLRNCFHSETLKSSMPDDRKSRPNILHPQGPFLQRWNKIFVLSCIFAVSVDPLFLYIPVINDQNSCWYLDRKLEITASFLRSVTDIFYILHMIFQFWTGFITSSSTTFGRGVLVGDKYAIAKRYLSTYFWIDVCAVLPIPQVLCYLAD